MSLYTKAISTAQRLLKRYGQNVVITTYTSGVYDPALSSVQITPTTQSLVGAVFEMKTPAYAISLRE